MNCQQTVHSENGKSWKSFSACAESPSKNKWAKLFSAGCICTAIEKGQFVPVNGPSVPAWSRARLNSTCFFASHFHRSKMSPKKSLKLLDFVPMLGAKIKYPKDDQIREMPFDKPFFWSYDTTWASKAIPSTKWHAYLSNCGVGLLFDFSQCTCSFRTLQRKKKITDIKLGDEDVLWRLAKSI